MRKVAKFAFVSSSQTQKAGEDTFDRVIFLVRAWLEEKGDINRVAGVVRYRDGREASLSESRLESKIGQAISWVLSEPTLGGRFVTSISVGISGSEIGVNCLLSAGNPDNVVAPVSVDARCPQIVRTIVEMDIEWRIGGSRLPTRLFRVRGPEDATQLIDLLLADARSLPVIVVSEHHGLVLHPQLSNSLARELTALAIVAQIDDEASWEISRRLGKEWSCFNGALRLYWPLLDLKASPYAHPLWTSQRLLKGVATLEDAVQRIRRQLRRRLFAVSCFTVQTPSLFELIETVTFEEELSARRKLAEDHADYKGLAEVYVQENEVLKKDLASERELNKQLREDVYNLQTQIAWQGADEGEVLPILETQPSTVTEAVDRARKVFVDRLTFGKDVKAGVSNVAQDAGPPDKIYDYLETLAELAAARRAGNLGTSFIQWLEQQGVAASGESETIRNSPAEMKKRRWHDGRGDREFQLHLKPAEATSPDRCIRVYFEWDDASQKIIVGWIGRHP